MQELVRYWGTGYDWRKAEAKLNALPQFTTNIDGVDIHFIHVKSKEKNALPLIITHGWPGSVIEQLKIIDPLTNPTAHGGSAADAFDVVIPSLPGYGFSGHPSGPGGQPPGAAHGTDLDAEGNGTLTEQRTYQCIRQSGPIIDRTCTIEFLDRGVEVYCFTFG
jgi:pimeloyl-ACP methyl ester carboxylesterase